MDEKLLRELQLTEYGILKEIKRICHKYKIGYYITDGTLLGAVRHKGFIPWDDDLDIAMCRTDYEHFISVAQKELGEEFFLQTWNTDPYFAAPYAKILKNGTKCLEATMKDSKARNGVWVDVFPVDCCGDSLQMRKEMRSYLFYNKTLQMQCHYKIWRATRAKNAKWKYFPFIIAGWLLPRKYLIKKLTEISEEWNDRYKESGYCVENFGYNLTPWIFKRDYIKKRIQLEFEGERFDAPCDYKGYLTDMYGKYMVLPPENERGNQHNLLEVQL